MRTTLPLVILLTIAATLFVSATDKRKIPHINLRYGTIMNGGEAKKGQALKSTSPSLKSQRVSLRLGVKNINLPLSTSNPTQSSGVSRSASTSNSKQFVFDGVPIIHNGNEKWKNAIVTVLTYMKENDPDHYKAHKKHVYFIEFKKGRSSKGGADAWAKVGSGGGNWRTNEKMLEYVKGDGTSIDDIRDYFFAAVYHETQHCDVSTKSVEYPALSYAEPAACWATYHYLKRNGRPRHANFYKGLAVSKGFTKEMWDAYKKDLN